MSYQDFSYYYDSMMDERFYDDYLSFLMAHVRFHTVLELACGTGEMALRLAASGKKVAACDLSDDMLQIAQEKAMAAGRSVRFSRMDMRDFSSDQPFDLILCACDSLNYILAANDVMKVFHNVYASLDAQGYFVFDVDSLYKCNVLEDHYHEESHDNEMDFSWDIESDHHGYVKHHVVIIDHVNKNTVDEYHEQRTLSVKTYLDMLRKAGFKASVYSDFEAFHEECDRHIFVCQKEE